MKATSSSDVERGADGHREMMARERSFLRVAGLAGHLDGLLEALQREDHAGRERGENAVHAEGHEAAAGGEVAGWNCSDGDDDDASSGTAVFQMTTTSCCRT